MRYAWFLLLCGFAVAGLVDPNDPVPPVGEAGAPHRPLNAAEETQFLRGRLLFDRNFDRSRGVGQQFNGDSCRACHQDPVVGGAGGIDVQVQRPMMADGSSPPETGELAQTHSLPGVAREEIPTDALLVEERNSPTLLGLGLVQNVSDAVILAGEDPTDADGDGVFGVAHVLPGGAIGKLGWKANVPDVRAFVRDALSNEMGITVPNTGNPFGFTADADGVADPEATQPEIDDLVFFLELLDFAPKGAPVPQGEALFTSIGCAKCHVPVLDGVEAYTDLLLHDVQPPGFQGVAQGMAISGLYRTAPLRGLRHTDPYFHDGRSETIDAAIRRHSGEALAIRQAYESLSQADRDLLLAFLRSL